jgi:hypothetical protein
MCRDPVRAAGKTSTGFEGAVEAIFCARFGVSGDWITVRNLTRGT